MEVFFDIKSSFFKVNFCFQYEALSSYDSRGNYTNLHSSLANTIWMPDIYLGIGPPVYVHIFSF